MDSIIRFPWGSVAGRSFSNCFPFGQVITNSLPVASLFSDIGSIETTVTGGTLYRRLGTLGGLVMLW
jgi:hypothetical protein